jgi:hypothetical protein
VKLFTLPTEKVRLFWERPLLWASNCKDRYVDAEPLSCTISVIAKAIYNAFETHGRGDIPVSSCLSDNALRLGSNDTLSYTDNSSCGTQRCTSWRTSPWKNSSSARAVSTRAPESEAQGTVGERINESAWSCVGPWREQGGTA